MENKPMKLSPMSKIQVFFSSEENQNMAIAMCSVSFLAGLFIGVLI